MSFNKEERKTQKMGVVVFLFTMVTMFYLIPNQIMVPSTVKAFYMSPAFFPRMLTVILAVLALTLVFWPRFSEQGKGEEKDEETETKIDYKKVIICSLILFIYAFALIHLLGFITATIMVLAVLMLYAGNRNYRSIILVSILTPLILVLFFSKFVYVPFPTGIIIPW